MQKMYRFTQPLSADPDDVWAVLASLDTVYQWFPLVTTTRVDRSGDQPVRYCELANGMAIEERITEVDADKRVLGYTIDKGVPADRYSGRFAILDGDDGRAQVVWIIEVEASEEVLAQFDGMLVEAAAGALRGLDAAATQRAAA